MMDDDNVNSNSHRLLFVAKRFCVDAMGKHGEYSGLIQVHSGLPHQMDGDVGEMKYENDNNNGKDVAGTVKRYVGEWKDGFWHGQGTCYLANGDVYVGQFEYHQRQGTGKYRWKHEEIMNDDGDNNSTIERMVIKQRIYSGDFSRNQRHGYGTYTWKTLRVIQDDGDDDDDPVNSTMKMEIVSVSTYKGYFEHGLRQGLGVYSSPNVHYTGDWWNGLYHGYGVLQISSLSKDANSETKTMYRGYFNRGKREGRGIEVRQDGSLIFEGLWKEDKPVLNQLPQATSQSSLHGSATNTGNEEPGPESTSNAPSGASITSTVFPTPQPLADAEGYQGLYKGIVEQGLPQGVGTMIYKDHDSIHEYEGFWQSGVRHGYGRIYYHNRDNYEGNLVQNKRQGQGEYRTAAGTTTDTEGGRLYKGKFKDDLPHDSDFQVLYPNHDIYQGDYYQGHRDGYGKLEFSCGSYYEGEWELGMYHGKGQLVTQYLSYRGEFSKGVFHGHGCLKDANGNNTLYEGKWIEGRPEDEETVNTLSKVQLKIPHPPLDDPFSDTAEFGNGVISELVRTISPRPTLLRQASVPKGTVLPPPKLERTLAGSNENNQLFLSVSFASSILANWTGSTQSDKERQRKEDEECKAVVDMQVWDGQDNPGQFTGLLHLKTQRPHGVGRMVYQDGNRIHEGFWEYGHRQGHGRCLFLKLGDFHEGGYHQNLRHGQGKYYWQDGRMYSGNYHLDERHGEGRFVYPNGDVYQGNFIKGQRSGFGTFTFQNRTCRYQGNWENGTYHGQGKLEWIRATVDDDIASPPKRHCYVGQFFHGQFHGSGIKMVDGQVVREGIWEKGEFVRSEELPLEKSSASEVTNELDALSLTNASFDDPSQNPEMETLEEGEQSSNEPNKAVADFDVQRSIEEEYFNVPQTEREDSVLPEDNLPSAECASSLEQNYDLQRLQWRNSLEPDITWK